MGRARSNVCRAAVADSDLTIPVPGPLPPPSAFAVNLINILRVDAMINN